MATLVSAITTTYKRDLSVLMRALDSMLAQTYPDLEILIIDDNREDEEGLKFSDKIQSILTMEKYKSDIDRIRIYKTEAGKHGAQAARNTGIHNSNGDYLAFLDDDDEWLSEKIEQQANLMDQRPEVGMCFCAGIRQYDMYNPPLQGIFHGEFIQEPTYRQLLRGDSIGTTSQAMIRKSALSVVGEFDEALPARQDYEMWIRISHDFKVYGVDKPLFVYHIYNAGEQITKSWDSCIKGHTLLYEKYKKDIDSDRKSLFNYIFFMAHYYMKKGDKLKCVSLYMKSFFIAPEEFWKKGIIKIEQLMDKSKRSI